MLRIIDCLQDKVEIISCKLLNYSSVGVTDECPENVHRMQYICKKNNLFD